MNKELIYIDGVDKSKEILSCRANKNGFVVVYKNSNKAYNYSKNRVKIVDNKRSSDVFKYLKKIAESVGLVTEGGKNILAESYARIDFVPSFSILANFLSGKPPKTVEQNNDYIFPFGFNISQKEAVEKAFSSSLSVIEGPPGTGKTQTILNVIINALMDKKSVAVVSSNNSATSNVYEKFQNEGLEFVVAMLGNSDNKQEFISLQKPLPNLEAYKLSKREKAKIEDKCRKLSSQLLGYLNIKNQLALIKQESEEVYVEYKHFKKQNIYFEFDRFLYNQTSEKLLRFWLQMEKISYTKTKLSWWQKIIYKYWFEVNNNKLLSLNLDQMIFVLQSSYYPIKILELNRGQDNINKKFIKFDFEKNMSEYRELAMRLFRSELFSRFENKKREEYQFKELWSKSKQFIEDYPIVLSTTYSLRRSLANDFIYDYVIVDEASQVDLVTGALALSCARNTVIVGDLKQLPNVVDNTQKRKTDEIFDLFNIPKSYRYSDHSLLASVIEMFPAIPKTLLKEHYRCHPKIIEFCNKNFYNNQLIILSEIKGKEEPLKVYKTVLGNHARDKTNQRQIDMIKYEIIPKENLQNIDLGIVTPYRNQTNILQDTFVDMEIKADTVDKFQGRENDVIILSTVDDEISDFTDNPNRLNVAISRAKNQLILVVNSGEDKRDSNIADLIRYIEYNNFSVIESEISSVFDYLYKGYEKERAEIISKSGKRSEFDSENLMYSLIVEVLKDERFAKYGVVLHYPIRRIFTNLSKLTEEEQKYAQNHNAHVDFLIYNKLGKNPILAIEVDGYAYHKQGTKQADRDDIKDAIFAKYNLPIIRFSTTGSGEKARLISMLEKP